MFQISFINYIVIAYTLRIYTFHFGVIKFILSEEQCVPKVTSLRLAKQIYVVIFQVNYHINRNIIFSLNLNNIFLSLEYYILYNLLLTYEILYISKL